VAKESLANTMNQLEVLAKANVVDAGAKGFVLFLEGMIDFFKNRQSGKKLALPANDMLLEDVQPDSHEEITFRYCCEAMLSLDQRQNETKESIRSAIGGLGDSVVVAGSEKRLRIHIHSDMPIKLFETLSKRSSITYQKVDDMVMQQQMAHERKYPVALLTDSTCDLPVEILEKYQITMVPLSLHVGQSHFLDRTTISSQMFYDLFDTSSDHPSTSQPSYKDFINKYAYLNTHFDSTIAIHISKQLSGTFSNSTKAAVAVSEQSGKNISVLNSKRVSNALGLIVLRAAEAIADGQSHHEVVDGIESWTKKCHILVSARTVKYLVRSGRLSHTKGFIGRLLKVNPIISMDEEGRGTTFGKSFNEKGNMRRIIEQASKIVDGKRIWGYAISHIRNAETAAWYATEMEKLTAKKPLFVTDCSPVLGVNGGPGTVVLSLMEE
jgi:DegV family protein with EDD domain